MANSNKIEMEQSSIIDLAKILHSKDSDQIRQMQVEFETNGWCFVRLPPEFIPSDELREKLWQFFLNNTSKVRYSQPSGMFGYSKTNHKEGVKVLTGSYYNEFANKVLVPSEFVRPLNYLVQVLDAAVKRLIDILDGSSVFQQTPSLEKLIESAGLPLNEEHFGMLDIVSYFNERSHSESVADGRTTEEVNCVPHYDPGLLSISLLSTHEGLQLKRMHDNQWINGPLEADIGVIWLGKAACRVSENRLKPGIHRVIYPRDRKQRLTLWYEICTIQQLQVLKDIENDKPMLGGAVMFENLPDSEPMDVSPGEQTLDFLKRIEAARGLSSSKLGPPFYVLEQYDISYPRTESHSTDRK